MYKVMLVACMFAASAASPVLAANANRPYQNCDRKIDNCGPTGNDMTDQLNAQQLSNGGSGGASMPMQGSSMPMQGSGGTAMGGPGMNR